jgi:hypothetical protein
MCRLAHFLGDTVMAVRVSRLCEVLSFDLNTVATQQCKRLYKRTLYSDTVLNKYVSGILW